MQFIKLSTIFTQLTATIFIRCDKIVQKHSSAVDLSYKILGYALDETDTPPILIFHGFLGNKKNWTAVGKVLMKVTKRSVIPVDLRNHGNSPHAASHNYELLAADVLKLCNKLNIEKATLIGHSMGGRTAMVVSLIEPSKVEKLVVLDISPVSTTQHLKEYFPKILSSMKEVDFTGCDTATKGRAVARKHLLNVIVDEVILGAVLMNINVTRSKKIGWLCNLDVLIKEFNNVADFPASLLTKKYNGPTLFIGGQFSEYIPADDLPAIRDLFPQAVVKYIAKAGHNLHVDNTAAFLQLLVTFLRIDE